MGLADDVLIEHSHELPRGEDVALSPEELGGRAVGNEK